MLEILDTWLRTAAERLHDEAPRLTSLDQAIGDGDHGINMDRGSSPRSTRGRRRTRR